MLLTNEQCKRAKPKARQYSLTDGGGLELCITPKAAKLWRFRYRFNGERCRLTIGHYPTMKLAAARVEAGRLRDMVLRGEDPAAARSPISRGALLGDVVDTYVAEQSPAWKDNTARAYGSPIKTFRDWAAANKVKRAADLTPSVLLSFRAYAIERPSRRRFKDDVRSIPGKRRTDNAINAELRAIRTMLQTLRKAKRLPALTSRDAIVDNLGFVSADRPRPDPLKPAQLRALVVACLHRDRGSAAWSVLPLVLTILLSGMRLGEALRLTWSDVDFDDRTLRIVPGKTGHERTVDLHVSPALVRVLASLPRSGSRVFDVTKVMCRTARRGLIARFDAPPFLYSTRHSRPGERSFPTLRSTCGSYLTCSPGIFGAASVFMSAAQLGHSVETAQRHYLGAVRRIDPNAKTLEAAMGIDDLLADAEKRLRVVK